MTVARYALPALAVLAAFAIAAPVRAQDRVGVTSAVNPAATGTPPGQATRTLLLGNDVVFNERITTEAGGQTELLFLDRSSFSIGPNSDLVIDQFVYDPAAGTGKLAASAAKGVFRFVGGALSKNPDGVTIRTPTATIGLRGGICVFSLGPGGALNAVLLYGRNLSVTAQGVTQSTSRPNHMISVQPSQAPAPPTMAPPGTMSAVVAQLDGRPGASGGAVDAPSGERVQRSGVTVNNSQNTPVATADAQRNGAPPAPPPAPPPTTGNSRDTQQGGDSGQRDKVEVLTPTSPGIPDFSDIDAAVQASFASFFTSLGGTLTPPQQMPTTGVATYVGTATGSVVFSNSIGSSASGGYQQIWDFGSRSGSVQISNFAGINLSGSVTALPSASMPPSVSAAAGTVPNIFTGTISNASITGSVTGGFGDLRGPAGEVRGSFGFSGTGISGGGTFQGTKGAPPG